MLLPRRIQDIPIKQQDWVPILREKTRISKARKQPLAGLAALPCYLLWIGPSALRVARGGKSAGKMVTLI